MYPWLLEGDSTVNQQAYDNIPALPTSYGTKSAAMLFARAHVGLDQ